MLFRVVEENRLKKGLDFSELTPSVRKRQTVFVRLSVDLTNT